MTLISKLRNLSKSKIQITNKLKNDKLADMRSIVDRKKVETRKDIIQKVENARVWLEEFTGLDKVSEALKDVSHYQNEFIKSQNERRQLGTELNQIQIELNNLHNEIVVTNRSDELYLQLITKEHKLLKLENQLRTQFAVKESEERENFTLFTTKIKESQDKEKEQALKTKYWTIIVSSAVTVIGVLGNGVISFWKMHTIDSTMSILIEETHNLNQNMDKRIENLQNQINNNQLINIKNSTKDTSSIVNTTDVIASADIPNETRNANTIVSEDVISSGINTSEDVISSSINQASSIISNSFNNCMYYIRKIVYLDFWSESSLQETRNNTWKTKSNTALLGGDNDSDTAENWNPSTLSKGLIVASILSVIFFNYF